MQMHRQSLSAYGAALCETIVDAPRPQGAEVLVRIERCGVCHSDLHMQDGYFLLGDGKKLDVQAGRALPFTLGHEIAGLVESSGSDSDAKPGAEVAVYPWIGCGRCAACGVGDENICAAPRHLGVTVDGGFATHVLVPHSRYLIDYAPLAPGFAGALMCSELTAYAALKRLADRAQRAPLLLVGLGGVGLMGLALARAMYGTAPFIPISTAKSTMPRWLQVRLKLLIQRTRTPARHCSGQAVASMPRATSPGRTHRLILQPGCWPRAEKSS